jgi:hypothetical protein
MHHPCNYVGKKLPPRVLPHFLKESKKDNCTARPIWAFWITRNDHIFKGRRANLFRCKQKIKEELACAMHRARSKTLSTFKDWMQNYN